MKSNAQDDEWKLFPAKLIHQTKSDVLPIFFDGKNGLLFHLFASKLKNQTLKYSTYIQVKQKKMIGKEITLCIGNIINYDDISHIKERDKLTKHLKRVTYDLKNECKEIFIFIHFINSLKLKNISDAKLKLDKYLEKKLIKGTILLANEGINGSVSSSKTELENLLKFIRQTLNIKR